MKKDKNLILSVIFFTLVFTMQGCELVGDIFGAGVFVGVALSAIVTGIILFLIYKIFRWLRK